MGMSHVPQRDRQPVAALHPCHRHRQDRRLHGRGPAAHRRDRGHARGPARPVHRARRSTSATRTSTSSRSTRWGSNSASRSGASPRTARQVRTVSLDVPTKDELRDQPQPLARVPEDGVPALLLEPQLRAVAARRTSRCPRPASRCPRAVAKAIYGHYYYGERQDAGEGARRLRRPASTRPSCPRWCWCSSPSRAAPAAAWSSTWRGTCPTSSSGGRIPVIGVGVAAVLGRRGARRRRRRAVPDDERDRLHARRRQEPGRHGGLGRPLQEPLHRRLPRPAPGALLAAPGLYTKTGEPAIRDGPAQGRHPQVRQRLVHAASSCRTTAALLFKMLRPAGFTGAPHERNISGDRTWTLFDVAKYTHPGVEVLPGEPRSKWREVVSKWIDYIPQWSGLKEGFKTDYIEVHTVGPRELWNDTLQKKLEETSSGATCSTGDDGTLVTSRRRVLRRAHLLLEHHHPGRREDRHPRPSSRRGTPTTQIESWDEKLLMHSWLLDLGVMLSRAVDPLRRHGRRVHLGLRLLGRGAARGDPRRRPGVGGHLERPGGRTSPPWSGRSSTRRRTSPLLTRIRPRRRWRRRGPPTDTPCARP